MSTPAGWYPDTERTGEQRYWDGEMWTDHRAPLVDSGGSQPPRRSVGKTLLVGAGVLVVGLVGLSALGAMTGQQDEPKQGAETVPLSVLLGRATENPSSVMKWGASPKGQAWQDFLADIDDFNSEFSDASDAGDDEAMLTMCGQAGFMGIQGVSLMDSPSAVLNETWSEVRRTTSRRAHRPVSTRGTATRR
ncbi:MAG: DUF2510 domain-containing protein [Actinomycetia bacterium]|nr:DUF2510 domain-containing protein [Actinomycetes bacterium]